MSYIIRMAAVAAALIVSARALAAGGIAEVRIIDRGSGRELVPHYYRGEYWVAGTPGATYSIQIGNRLGGRLLAVTSVDGINVISGAEAGWDQSGYVFNPGQAYQITGWRKSEAEVAAFTFTDLPSSYAARTGRPANVGIIGVALFRERPAPQDYEGPPPQVYQRPGAQEQPLAVGPRASGSVNAPQSPTSSADAAERQPEAPPSAESKRQPRAEREVLPSAALRSAPKLGTGHGDRESSYVRHTEFNRMQSQPDEIIRIRYDSFDNLVAMGVIERPRKGFPTADPFPASAQQQQYVPDPPSVPSMAPGS